MKLVTTVIQSQALPDVRAALCEKGVCGITVTEVAGSGQQQGHSEVYRGARYAVNFIPKIKIEIALVDEQVEMVVQTIVDSARTGNVGDGKIWISPIDEVIRVRTGTAGEAAL